MTKNELIKAIFDSNIMRKWHWFTFHFQMYALGSEHHFAKSILDALLNIEDKIPGYAMNVISRMASICGREKNQEDYEQLMQICGEVYITNQAVSYYKNKKSNFKYEPFCGETKKNPEFIIECDDWSLGIEVKQPSLLKHGFIRSENPIQLPMRAPGLLDTAKKLHNPNGVTLPRDNPVKDFLISANDKFKEFKKHNSNFYGVLFIIWDDYIYEPISSLVGKPSGIFQEDSFAKDKTGQKLEFPNVDAVFIDRQLSQFRLSAGDKPLLYSKQHAMDYGTKEQFPFKVIIKNPIGKNLPEEIIDCFQVLELSPTLGAEYLPQDMVFWFNI